MIENSFLSKTDRTQLGREAGSAADVSMTHRLQALSVLARALTKRIDALTREPEPTANLAHEVQNFESELILSALVETGGRQRAAARLLGMNITTLNRKLRRYRLDAARKSNGLHDEDSAVEHLS